MSPVHQPRDPSDPHGKLERESTAYLLGQLFRRAPFAMAAVTWTLWIAFMSLCGLSDTWARSAILIGLLVILTVSGVRRVIVSRRAIQKDTASESVWTGRWGIIAAIVFVAGLAMNQPGPPGTQPRGGGNFLDAGSDQGITQLELNNDASRIGTATVNLWIDSVDSIWRLIESPRVNTQSTKQTAPEGPLVEVVNRYVQDERSREIAVLRQRIERTRDVDPELVSLVRRSLTRIETEAFTEADCARLKNEWVELKQILSERYVWRDFPLKQSQLVGGQ